MANPSRRAALTHAWVVVVLAWSAARAVVVGRTLGRYGVNPWAYGALDLAVSWPYAMATAGVVTAVLDRRLKAARRSAGVAAATFLAPDLYLVLAGHGKPAFVYLVVIAVAAAFAGSALVSIAVQVRRGRAVTARSLEGPTGRRPSPTPATPSRPGATTPAS